MQDIEPFYNWRYIYVSEKTSFRLFTEEPTLNLNFPWPFTIIISIRNGMILAAALYT
jgi:hypothetical protein